MRAFFVSDLHGHRDRYLTLFDRIEAESPDVVFFGGDLLPSRGNEFDSTEAFLDWFFDRLRELRKSTGAAFIVILGNDDPRHYETHFTEADARGTIIYAHFKALPFQGHDILGYSYITPTPFRLKDWEKYDVSRFTDPGCFPPEEGTRTMERPPGEGKNITMAGDLQEFEGSFSPDRMICLFHSPPYGCSLDTADLHGKMIDWAPLDVHIGSFAIKRFIAGHQPLITLHGHVHESARLTGQWRQTFGRTHSFSAAHDGPELALVRFDTGNPGDATRELI